MQVVLKIRTRQGIEYKVRLIHFNPAYIIRNSMKVKRRDMHNGQCQKIKKYDI